MYALPMSPPSTPSSPSKEMEEDTNSVHSDGEGCQSETSENVDLDAVQSLLAMSQWSPHLPERNTPSPDSGLSSISRNSSSASLSSATSVEDEPEKHENNGVKETADFGIPRGNSGLCSPTSGNVTLGAAIMARGPKKHLKRLNAPHHWMLDKLSGKFAPRPSTGPHKLRECLPLIVFLRNRLKYALTYDEVKKILKQRLIKVDGKVRTDVTYPAGFMDVISIEKTGENFRLLYDVKGRFTVHRITGEEAKYKLGQVRRVATGAKGVPYLVTHDGRTIRYPDPLISLHDTVVIEIKSGKIIDFIKFDTGNLAMVVGGRNMGRVGIVTHRERHAGSFDIVHVKDNTGHQFATRISNIFIIGKTNKPHVSLPKGKGVRLTIAEERDRRLQEKAKMSSM